MPLEAITSDSAAKSFAPGRQADDVLMCFEPRCEAPVEAADQRVGVAAMQRQRADHRGDGAHHRARGVRRHALASGDLEISRDIVAIARIVCGDRSTSKSTPGVDAPGRSA